MGQKINPNIFRLGVNKTWKTEFFEKKPQELPVYTFKDLEIKSYIERFAETQGLLLHDYKQHYSNSTLNLYISYFIAPDCVVKQNSNKAKLVLVDNVGSQKPIVNQYKAKKRSFLPSNSSSFVGKTPSKMYQMKTYVNSQKGLLFGASVPIESVHSSNAQGLKIEGILNNLFKVLSLFTNNKFNIITNFCCLNKNLSFLKKTQKKDFIQLQKFKSTPFLKEGIELLFHVVYNKNSANLLAKFVALQTRKIKRHKFFLAFLQQTLTVLSSSSFSRVKGIKIIIKGRLNGVPRARHKIITIGDVPVQSIGANIDYAQTSVCNANGSYGIKVWIVEK